MRVAVAVVVACLIPLLVGEVGATVTALSSDTVLITGVENITSFCTQLESIYPYWTYYDESTGEYVINSTALPGGDIWILLDSDSKLIIDKPLRVENTVDYPLPEPYPESDLRDYTDEEFGLYIASQVLISNKVGASNTSVEISGTTVNVKNMEFRIQGMSYVSVTNSIIKGEGQIVDAYTCAGGCCYFKYSKTTFRITHSDVFNNVSLQGIALVLEGARTIDNVEGLGDATFQLVTYQCPEGSITVNGITGYFTDSLNSGVLINNMWNSNNCYVEVKNGWWHGAATFLTGDNGNLVVRDTVVFTNDKSNIRIEGDVTLINTILNPPESEEPSTKELDLTDIESHITINVNCSDVQCHIYDREGDGFDLDGIDAEIRSDGTHAYASGIVEVTKYPDIVLSVNSGSARFVNALEYRRGEYYSFQLSSDNSDQEVIVTVGGFEPDKAVKVYYTHNGERELLGNFYTDEEGKIVFTYDKGFSDVILEVNLDESPLPPIPTPIITTTTTAPLFPLIPPAAEEPSLWGFFASIYGIVMIICMVIAGFVIWKLSNRTS